MATPHLKELPPGLLINGGLALNHLKKKEAEIEKTKEQQAELESKMHQIEQKVIQGGVNLLEKDEEQQRLLEESNREMQERIQQQNAMRRKIDEVDVTLDDINKKYATLQEEAQEKTRKLKKIWTMFNVAKSELADIEAENARETEALLDNIRELQKVSSKDKCYTFNMLLGQ